MPIYEAEFLGDAKPIRAIKPSKKTKKTPPAPVPIETALVADPAPFGLNKKGQPYKRKQPVKTHLDTPPPSATSEAAPAPEEEAEAPKPKRVRKKAPAKEPTEAQPDAAMNEVEPATVKKISKKAAAAANKKIIVAGDVAEDPPSWFKAYLHDEQKRRNADKPKKERMPQAALKQASDVQAAVKWSDGLTKDRVTNEVNGHMNRLYQQIHGKKY